MNGCFGLCVKPVRNKPSPSVEDKVREGIVGVAIWTFRSVVVGQRQQVSADGIRNEGRFLQMSESLTGLMVTQRNRFRSAVRRSLSDPSVNLIYLSGLRGSVLEVRCLQACSFAFELLLQSQTAGPEKNLAAPYERVRMIEAHPWFTSAKQPVFVFRITP